MSEDEALDDMGLMETYEPATDEPKPYKPRESYHWGNVLVPVRAELLEFLVRPKGSVRDQVEGHRTLTFWYDGSRWVACLRCKEENCVAFQTGDTVVEVFAELQKSLRRETLKWKEIKKRD